MNDKLAKFQKELKQLKLVLDSPRLFLADYFSNLMHEVDLTCQVYMNSQSDEKVKFENGSDKYNKHAENAQKALDHQTLLIDKIKDFEKECYNALQQDKLDTDLTLQVQKILQSIEAKLDDLEWTETNADRIDELLYKTLSKIHKSVFLNSTMFFLSKEELSRLKINSFGMLVLIRGEFFGKRVIGKINDLWIHRYCFVETSSEEESSDEDNILGGYGESEEYYCLKDELDVSKMNNETIKTLYFNQYFMKHLKKANTYSPFNEIHLNMYLQEK